MHPAIRPWVEGFVEEATAFPYARNDDQVDAMTQALHRLRCIRANFGVPESQIVRGVLSHPGQLAASLRHHRHAYRGGRLVGRPRPEREHFSVRRTSVAARGSRGERRRCQTAGGLDTRCGAYPVFQKLAGREEQRHPALPRAGPAGTHCPRRGRGGLLPSFAVAEGTKAEGVQPANRLLSEYCTGDESALLLQCCYALLVSARHCMRPKVAPQIRDSVPSVYLGERGWMT